MITEKEALLWTDGRYFAQAEKELDSASWKLMRDGTKDVLSIPNWLSRVNILFHSEAFGERENLPKNLEKQTFVGCDPQLISIKEWKEWKETLEQADKQLVPIETNLIDVLWGQKRPLLPDEQIWKYQLQFAGLIEIGNGFP